MKVEYSIPPILTVEERKYLRSYTRYLKSMGMSEGQVEIDFEDSELDEIDFSDIQSFSNNYKVEITEELTEIFQKIFKFIDKKGLLENPLYDDLNYRRLEIEIDCKKFTISVSDYYTYFETSSTEQTEYTDLEQIEPILSSIFSAFEQNKVEDIETTLSFNGSGDSGYIESEFDNNVSVPSNVEDWCYHELENHYGGWEINEGSQGQFIFNLKKQKINLFFTANVEEQVHNTIFEENFSN